VSEPGTRRTLLAGAGAGALALVTLSPAAASAQPARSDVEIVEELLVLEHRLESAYAAALRRDAIGAELGELLRSQEREHIRALEQVLRGLGGTPRATVPSPELGSAVRGRDAFARFAVELEGEAITAYVEAAGGISRPGLRRPLGSIMTCEAGHEVALRAAGGLPLLTPER
jgi:Ferritin-like domain